MQEDFLRRKLDERAAAGALRRLVVHEGLIDFCSNDYLGLARHSAAQVLRGAHGSGGSRLISGNSRQAEELEERLAHFHEAPAALLFNSGYDANLGLLSAVAGRNDTILFDQLSHASIRDGIRLSFARSFSFAHNSLTDLEDKLQKMAGNCFVVTESIFSMDGDLAPLREMIVLCQRYGAHLIVDEAHATGVVGDRGAGLCQELGLAPACFARIYTFGKALGAHGAVVAGSASLKEYLLNFARSFIYTTALPPVSLAAISEAYDRFPGMQEERAHLRKLIGYFNERVETSSVPLHILPSQTPIQAILVPGNDRAVRLAADMQAAGLDVRAIRYPTVPKGMERLRVVLHSFNSLEEIDRLFESIKIPTSLY